MSATGTSSRYSVARRERLDDRIDCLGEPDRVVGCDARERVGDVAREVVSLPQRLRHVPRLGPAPEREQREHAGVPADRRLGGCRALLERPACELVEGCLVARQQRRLQRADRPAPGVATLAGIPALAPACGRPPQPFAGPARRPPSDTRAPPHTRYCRAERERARRAPRAAPRSAHASRRRPKSNPSGYVVLVTGHAD